MQIGDRHNFNRCTVVSADKIKKPRPVFWEWLFFGASSPLRSVFKNDLRFESLFQIEFQGSVNGLTGEVIPVRGLNPISGSIKTLQSLAYTLAYSTYFGISDLNKSNILETQNGVLLPIDVECVLMPMNLCNDTGLLPHRNIDAKYCAFNQFGPSLSTDEITIFFILPFIESFIELIRYRSSVLFVLDELKSNIDKTPIRVILRETSEYYPMLENSDNHSQISEEERVQLIRGDIPYFFTFLGQQELFYYINAEGNFAPVENPILISFEANRVALAPSKLIDRQRLTNTLVYSALWLAKKIAPTDFNLNGLDFAVEKSGGHTQFIFDGQTFCAK